MNYFNQITTNNSDNLKLLLTSNGERVDDLNKMILFKKHVEIVNIELTYKCNRKCDYCPVSSSDRKFDQITMNESHLIKIVNELSSIRYENRISLNLYNEPMMDKNLYRKVKIIRDHLPHCNIGFNSNGDYLNDRALELLSESGLDFICVTLHPAPNKIQSSRDILRRVEKLLLKLHYKNLTFNFDEAAVISHDHVSITKHGVKLRIQWPDWRQEGTNRAGTIDKLNSKTQRTSPCMKPFREFTIFYDGSVQPCCESFHDEINNFCEIGNIKDKSIFDLYASNKLSDFRSQVFDFSPKSGICAHCTVKDYSAPSEDPLRKSLLDELRN
jgi:MoaA/NifB/PqqE/SkfB family radical SAM enzyme